MVSVLTIALCVSSVIIVSGERLYTPPTVQQRYPPPPPPRVADPGKFVGTTPNPAIRQRPAEFLPQNLTFVLSVRNLKSNSADPVVKVSKSEKGTSFETVGKTETLDNTANPDFLKVLWIIWKRGTQQKLKLEVRDVDNFRRDDPLGYVEFDVDEYVAKGEKLNVTLRNGTGSILIQKTTPVKFRLYARDLPNADTIGKSDPYAEVYWSNGSNGKKIKFARTAIIENNENPDWNETFEFANYIKGTDQWWTFKVYDSDPTGSDDLGEAIMEVDPFVIKRSTKLVSIGKKGTSKLGITPAS